MPAIFQANPFIQILDDDADPASGYKLFTYETGTTTKTTTYTDYTMGAANTNPITLDAAGRCSIFLPSGASIKYVLALPTDTDPPTSPLLTVDGVTAAGSGGGGGGGSVLYFDATTRGSVGTAETDLGSYTLPADTVTADGQVLRVVWAGTISSNDGNNKTFKVYVGGTQVASYTSSASNQGWRLQTEIVRTGTSAQFAMSLFENVSQPAQNGSAAVSWASDQIIKLTATSTVNFDSNVVEKMMLVEFMA